MATNNISERVAELSATLAPISEPLTGSQFSEIWGMATDYISYNTPYYCNGLQHVDFSATFRSCVMESCGEFQVLRLFTTSLHMNDDELFRYYSNELDNQDNDDWMDDEEYGEDELEVDNISEYKQIWINRKGKYLEVNLEEPNNYYESETFVNVISTHDWITTPDVAPVIMSYIVKEYSDYCYTDCQPVIEPMLRDVFFDMLSHFLPSFANAVSMSGYINDAMKYYRTIKVAIKHKYELPTSEHGVTTYFAYLNYLAEDGICLTEPYYVCPTDLQQAYNVMVKKKEKKIEDKILEEISLKEGAFAKLHSYLFGIEFDDEHFHYKSLDSIKAYYIESKIMHHCIYRASYYNKHDVLSMHITDHEGNRVATCSVNLKEGRIIELQTMCNDKDWRKGNEYKAIWNTLMARMHTFPRREEEQQTDKSVLVA